MWYYAEHGMRIGPFDSDQLCVQVEEGSLSPTTMVWKEGMERWIPFSQIEELHIARKRIATSKSPAALAEPEPVQAETTPFIAQVSGIQNVCCECQQSRSSDITVKLGGRWVCAYWKPTYLQKLEEKVYERRVLNYAGFSSRCHVGFTELTFSFVIFAFLLGFYGLSFRLYEILLVGLSIKTIYEIVAVGTYGNTALQNRWGLYFVEYLKSRSAQI